MSEAAIQVMSWFVLQGEPGKAIDYVDLVGWQERMGVGPQELNDGLDELVRLGKLRQRSRRPEGSDVDLICYLLVDDDPLPAVALGPRSRVSPLAERHA